MKAEKYDDILYARGYVVSPRAVTDFPKSAFWTCLQIGLGESKFVVYYDPRNEVAYECDEENFAFILGYAIDPEKDIGSLAEICKQILSVARDDARFLSYTDTLCGRYIIIRGNGHSAALIQDACGMRTCYYGNSYVASHYELLNSFEGHDEHPFFKTYMGLSKRPWYLPGDLTPFEGIRALLPNHELDLKTHQIRRIFPREDMVHESAEKVAAYCAWLISKEVKMLSEKYRLTASCTNGNDTRITLSALKEIKDKVLLHTYDNHRPDNAATGESSCEDNQAARYIAKTFGFKFMGIDLEVGESTPYGFVVNIRHNHYCDFVPRAAYMYGKFFPHDKDAPWLHIRSTLPEIIRARDYFRVSKADENAHGMAKLAYGASGLGDDGTVVKLFENYFLSNEYQSLHGFDFSDIFYDEYRMGVWHSGAILLSTDATFDTCCLFNQRKLIRLGLSVPAFYKRTNFLIERVCELLWPEILFTLPHSDRNLLQDRSLANRFFTMGWEGPVFDSNCEDYYHRSGQCFAEFGFTASAIQPNSQISVQWDVGFVNVQSCISFVLTARSVWHNTYSSLDYEILCDDSVVERGKVMEILQGQRLVKFSVDRQCARHTLRIVVCEKRAVTQVEPACVIRVASLMVYMKQRNGNGI